MILKIADLIIICIARRKNPFLYIDNEFLKVF